MAQVKAKDLKWEELALRKRLEFVNSLKQALEQDDSLVARTVDGYTGIIDDLINEVCLEVHRAVKTGQDDLSDLRRPPPGQLEDAPIAQRDQLGANPSIKAACIVSPPLAASHIAAATSKGAADMFGNQIQPIALDQVFCPSCGRAVAAGRFAPHLDKCMGRGRQASRNAHRRLSELEDII